MKLKSFKEKNAKRKAIIVGSFFVVLFISTMVFLRSFALFETKQEYNVIKGLVPNYQGNDLKIAVLVDGSYSKNFPSKDSGYYFEKITCSEEIEANFSSVTWKLTVKDITNPTKCTVSFLKEKKQLFETVLLNQDGGKTQIKAKGTPDFSKGAIIDEGLFASLDDYGETYYYRGDVKDNYVFFAGFYWRIVRINGDRSIRLIYAGNKKDSTGNSSGIAISSYNSIEYDNAQIGYMFGKLSATEYASAHQNVYSSTAKTLIDSFYENYLIEYNSYFSDTLFCNDRSLNVTGIKENDDTGTGYGKNITYYSGWYRLFRNKLPTFVCQNKNDRFTVDDESKGNGNLTYPIALITGDEILFTGANDENSKSYLNTGVWQISMTPVAFYKNITDLFDIRGYGDLSVWNSFHPVSIRPVINLKPDTMVVSGNGTQDNPFFIT